MSRHHHNLHGSVPDHSTIALLLVDVINPLDFPEADQLWRYALPAAERLAVLKQRYDRPGRHRRQYLRPVHRH
jgi:hypothetical protein